MKRDLAAVSLCVCLLIGFTVWGAQNIVPASLLEQATDSLPVLILDAGHGGEDGGAVSASGAEESDINLEITLKLESLMAFLGHEPVLTRRDDISLHDEDCTTLREKKVSDLKHRVELVNAIPNAMLISIHQNFYTDPRYSGAQVFYNPGDVSRQWGEQTQQALSQVLGRENQRKAMGLSNKVYLFEQISCPATLVECGFLSNGEEASLLQTDGYQKMIAVALAGSYLNELALLQYSGGN